MGQFPSPIQEMKLWLERRCVRPVHHLKAWRERWWRWCCIGKRLGWSFLRDAEAESSGRFVNPGALRKVLLQFHLPKVRISSPFHAWFNKMDGKKSAMFAWLILFNCLRGGGVREMSFGLDGGWGGWIELIRFSRWVSLYATVRLLFTCMEWNGRNEIKWNV